MLFDDAELTLPCPQCGQERVATIGQLRADPDFVCGGCGSEVHVNASKLVDEIGATEEALKRMGFQEE